MENFRLLLNLYLKPAATFSEIMDGGSWLFAGLAVALVAATFQFGINRQITESYAVSYFDRIAQSSIADSDLDEASIERVMSQAEAKRAFPVAGSSVAWLFSFDSSFVSPLIILAVFFVPGAILLVAFIARLGNAGTVIGSEYGTFSTCVLMAWAAAHLPFGLIGLALGTSPPGAEVFVALWALSGLAFGVLLVFAIRTVFGVGYGEAAVAACLSWVPYSIGVNVLEFVSPWFFSPFLLIYAILFFGGYMRGGVAGLSTTMRRKRDFKRFLQNATVNPNDADAHVQLGIIYSARRQNEKAREHFMKAFDIDKEEIDANYELGVLARMDGEFQKAIEHFATVVGQNDTFRVNEIWREIGVTYMEAGMPNEAKDALEKYVSRRPFDGEGLYHFGMVLKGQGENDQANEMFERAVEALSTAPYHRRRVLAKWAKLAKREIV